MSSPTPRQLLEQGDRKGALRAAEERLARHPADPEALATLAKLSLEAGDVPATERWLSQLKPKDRADYDVGLVEAMLLAQQGSSEAARLRYADLIAQDPKRAEANFGLGFLLFGAGFASEAVAPLTSATTLNPKSWANHFYLAGALLKTGQLQAGLTHLKDALALNPLHPPIYLAWVTALMSLGRLDEAQALLEEGLKLVKENPALLSALSNVLVAKRDLAGALKATLRAVAVAPADPAVQGDLARLELAHGHFDEALKICAALEAKGQATAQSWMVHAMALESRPATDLRGAADAYRQAMEADPSGWAAPNNLGLLLSQLSEKDKSLVGEAQAALEEAVRRAPERAESKLNLAILLGREGHPAEAKKLAKEVAKVAVDPGLLEQAQRLLSVL